MEPSSSGDRYSTDWRIGLIDYKNADFLTSLIWAPYGENGLPGLLLVIFAPQAVMEKTCNARQPKLLVAIGVMFLRMDLTNR